MCAPVWYTMEQTSTAHQKDRGWRTSAPGGHIAFSPLELQIYLISLWIMHFIFLSLSSAEAPSSLASRYKISNHVKSVLCVMGFCSVKSSYRITEKWQICTALLKCWRLLNIHVLKNILKIWFRLLSHVCIFIGIDVCLYTPFSASDYCAEIPWKCLIDYKHFKSCTVLWSDFEWPAYGT